MSDTTSEPDASRRLVRSQRRWQLRGLLDIDGTNTGRRFLGLLVVGLLVFLGSWTVAWLVLPNRLLQGRTLGGLLSGGSAASTFLAEWLLIVAINLAVILAVVILPNLLRSAGDYPLGYFSSLLLVGMFGLTLGTNSFAIPVADGANLAPSFAVLGGAGVYEVAAYLLAAAAVAGISRWRLQGRWPRQSVVRIADPRFGRADALGLLAAVVVVLVAAAWEAHMIASTASA